MATNLQMSIIRSSAPGPPLHIGASHLPRGEVNMSCKNDSFFTPAQEGCIYTSSFFPLKFPTIVNAGITPAVRMLM